MSAPTPGARPTVGVSLETDVKIVREGQQFEVRVSIKAGSDRPVDTAQVYLEFDPETLQVESIASGPRLEYLLLSTWDNAVGSAKCAAGTLGPPAESPFTLCSVTFRATTQAANNGVQVRFADRPNLHRTKVVSRGRDVTGELLPLEIHFR